MWEQEPDSLEEEPDQHLVFISGGKLWWADDSSGQLGTVTKRDGRNAVVLRNKTNGVVHMKVYERDGQRGEGGRGTCG